MDGASCSALESGHRQEGCRDGAAGEVTGAKSVSVYQESGSSRKKRAEALRHMWQPLRGHMGAPEEGQTEQKKPAEWQRPLHCGQL